MADITYNWSEVEWWSDATSDSRVRAYWRVVAWCEETDSENYSDVYFAIEKRLHVFVEFKRLLVNQYLDFIVLSLHLKHLVPGKRLSM